MQTIKELSRHASPAGRPQPLAFHAGTLWMGSWETDSLYAIDPQTWAVAQAVEAPGKPYGIAPFEGALSVVVSIGADDDRYLYRFDPQRGFDPDSKTACPDFTGSHLAADGDVLYLCQQGKRQILALDAGANVSREIALTARCAGFGFANGECFAITADEEFENLEFARFDLRGSTAAAAALASVPFDARALAFDGTQWWTSHREASEIVAFAS
jgi:hypothetical protein